MANPVNGQNQLQQSFADQYAAQQGNVSTRLINWLFGTSNPTQQQQQTPAPAPLAQQQVHVAQQQQQQTPVVQQQAPEDLSKALVRKNSASEGSTARNSTNYENSTKKVKLAIEGTTLEQGSSALVKKSTTISSPRANRAIEGNTEQGSSALVKQSTTISSPRANRAIEGNTEQGSSALVKRSNNSGESEDDVQPNQGLGVPQANQDEGVEAPKQRTLPANGQTIYATLIRQRLIDDVQTRQMFVLTANTRALMDVVLQGRELAFKGVEVSDVKHADGVTAQAKNSKLTVHIYNNNRKYTLIADL